MSENREMHVEECQVEKDGHNNQPYCSSSEVSPKVVLKQCELEVARNNMLRKFTIVYPFLISRMSQRSTRTAMPIVNTVRIPFTLEPHVNAMKAPVATSQNHHSAVNSLRKNQDKPNEPRITDSPVSKFAESDIRINRERHEKDQCRVEKNQTRLCNVGIIYALAHES